LGGRRKKTRLHLLVNPSSRVHLPGIKADGIELNIESLTHIITMETSVVNDALLDRTTHLAERTNKPIITNEETAIRFKERGLSVRQLRIIGHQQEVVDDIHIDPVYMQELSDEVRELPKKKRLDPVTDLLKIVNPLQWKPIKLLTKGLFPKSVKEDNIIDPSKPLAFHIEFSNSGSILLPLDKRGIKYINRIIPNLKPKTLILPNQDLAYTKLVNPGVKQVIILNGVGDEEPIIIPRSHNAYIPHDSVYGSLEVWIEIV